MEKLLKVKAKTVVSILVFAIVFFLLSGGVQYVNGLLFGYRTVTQARFGVTAPFFGCFLFTGFMGLMFAYRNFKVKGRCILGLVMAAFSFVAIEVLYYAVFR